MTRYTVAEAAKKVGRDRRTIERWITEGLRFYRESNIRYIRHEHLMAEARRRLVTNPTSRTAHGVRYRLMRRAEKDA